MVLGLGQLTSNCVCHLTRKKFRFQDPPQDSVRTKSIPLGAKYYPCKTQAKICFLLKQNLLRTHEMQRLCMSKNALSELHVTTTTRVDEQP